MNTLLNGEWYVGAFSLMGLNNNLKTTFPRKQLRNKDIILAKKKKSLGGIGWDD